jgi:hypothetical protein
MSRSKKSRSLKRNHSGVKTGTKERTKLESKQRKAKKKLANPRAVTRQRSVYQKHLDDNNLVEGQHLAPKEQQAQPTNSLLAQAQKKSANFKPEAKPKAKEVLTPQVTEENQEADLWDQLESTPNNDIF